MRCHDVQMKKEKNGQMRRTKSEEKKIKQLTSAHDLKSDIGGYVTPEDSVYGVSWPGEGGRQGATTLDCSGTKPAGQDHPELRMR